MPIYIRRNKPNNATNICFEGSSIALRMFRLINQIIFYLCKTRQMILLGVLQKHTRPSSLYLLTQGHWFFYSFLWTKFEWVASRCTVRFSALHTRHKMNSEATKECNLVFFHIRMVTIWWNSQFAPCYTHWIMH